MRSSESESLPERLQKSLAFHMRDLSRSTDQLPSPKVATRTLFLRSLLILDVSTNWQSCLRLVLEVDRERSDTGVVIGPCDDGVWSRRAQPIVLDQCVAATITVIVRNNDTP